MILIKSHINDTINPFKKIKNIFWSTKFGWLLVLNVILPKILILWSP